MWQTTDLALGAAVKHCRRIHAEDCLAHGDRESEAPRMSMTAAAFEVFTTSPELESATILSSATPLGIPLKGERLARALPIMMSLRPRFSCLKGGAMDTINGRFTKPTLSAMLFKRALGWLVLTAQFLLKKNPDLRW